MATWPFYPKRIIKVGREQARVISRALCLYNLERGIANEEIAKFLGKGERFVRLTMRRYEIEGLDAIYEKSRPGQEQVVTEKEKMHIIAMVSAKPPDGFDRWTVRLIATEAKRRAIVRTVGKDTVRKILHQADLKPWREKNVGYPQGTVA